MKHSERIAPIAAAASALVTLTNALPLSLAGGLAAFGLGTAVATVRPWLLGVSVVLLGVGGFQMMTGSPAGGKRSGVTFLLFGLCVVVVVLVGAFPQVVAGWLAAVP